MYRALDIFFVVLHTSVIIFNCLGWICKRTRRANLVLLLATAGSWLFLGLATGRMGYCPLTDWHFKILNKLGTGDLPASYIKYLADRLTGADINSSLVDALTLWLLVVALLLSIILNIRDYLEKKKSRASRA